MCNDLKRKNNGKFPESGYGWKVFDTKVWKDSTLFPTWHEGEGFERTKSGKWGWIKWSGKRFLKDNDVSINSGDGFCFFRSKKKAEKYSMSWGCVVKRIEYRKGIGQSNNAYLCKEFKIIEK